MLPAILVTIIACVIAHAIRRSLRATVYSH
jgi:hypothetical protein